VISRSKARGWFAAIGVALAVALAGCTDARPIEEVRAGGADSSTGSKAGSKAGSSTTVPAAADGSGSAGPGSPGGSGGGSEPGQPGSIDPAEPLPGGFQPPAPGDASPATTIPGDGRHAQQWDGYTVGADGRTLTFTYYAGVEPCSVFDSIVADEGPETVDVTIFERSGPEGVACIMLAQEKSASVTLVAPLGGRRVL